MAEYRDIEVLLGPQSEKGIYFYSKEFGFGGVSINRSGEYPLATVVIEKCTIGVDSIINPDSVAVETDDIVEAIQQGVEQIHEEFHGSLLNN